MSAAAEFAKSFFSWLFRIVGVAVILTVATIGLWQLGWWVKDQTVNRNAQISQDSYGRQNALTEAVLRGISDLENPNLPPAQRAALISEVCYDAARLTGVIQLPVDVTYFITKEC